MDATYGFVGLRGLRALEFRQNGFRFIKSINRNENATYRKAMGGNKDT